MSGLKKHIYEEKNGLHYTLNGDYYLPDLKLPEEHRPIGKYGRMHREYLREVHPARLNTLTLTGELWTYLADLNEQAQKRLDTIIEQMNAAEGVTEELKSICQMEWVQRCNNIHNRAGLSGPSNLHLRHLTYTTSVCVSGTSVTLNPQIGHLISLEPTASAASIDRRSFL